MTGQCLNPLFRLLVQKARKLAQEYMLIYEQNVPPTQLVKRVADVMQEYTQSGCVTALSFVRPANDRYFCSGVRPFGVSLLICGYDYDEDRPFLYQCDPSVRKHSTRCSHPCAVARLFRVRTFHGRQRPSVVIL